MKKILILINLNQEINFNKAKNLKNLFLFTILNNNNINQYKKKIQMKKMKVINNKIINNKIINIKIINNKIMILISL